MSIRRTCRFSAFVLLILVGLQARPATQNPITAARDAIRKAQEDARRQQEQARQKQQGTPSTAQPAPQAGQPAQPVQAAPSAQSAQPAPAASPFTAETTSKIAASLGYLDVAGIKFGMPLTNTMDALKALNPKFQFRPQEEIIWPLDRSNTAAQPPANAPKSTINVVAETLDGKGGVESFEVTFASHPNAPIVIGMHRKLGWAPATGPNFDSLLADLRKKYGPESLITSQTTNSAQRDITLRWYFDPAGVKLQGNLAQQPTTNCNVVSNGLAPGICGTLVVLDAAVSARGNGVVGELRVSVESHPLAHSARSATEAYLKAVDEERANRQRNESTGRPAPKL
jgi:hypothetical protein